MPWDTSIQISPSWPMSTSSSFSFNNLTSNNGLGFPIEPNFASIQSKVAIVNTVSVWPNPSLILSPDISLNLFDTSGGNGSPAVVTWCMFEKSYPLMFSLIKNLYIVGGAQKVFTLFSITFSSNLIPLNLS